MRIDDRPQLTAVWLVGGPGPDATWPGALGGRYSDVRREWCFPTGTTHDSILSAAAHAEADQSPRMQVVSRAVKAWTDQLIDRSARNNLLFFRDQRIGTLDLTASPSRTVFDILAGEARTLSQLVRYDEPALVEATRRARAIHRKALVIYEERGIHSLYLACGLATWETQHGTALPAAPVLLAPVALAARGASQQDFDLQVTGELEVNPTLLRALAAEFDIACDPEELLAGAGIEGAIDTQDELDVAYAWLTEKASDVPGFAVQAKLVLGNFSYARLPMVHDLQTSIEALAKHDLIAALAGDPDARQSIRDRRADIDPSLPDETPPANEFLVLDADSSQNQAINKVLSGQDLVIKGPPGTGKSQTISNLIAALVARGKTVLFVAEKRAAIDAVLKRLEQVGLDDVVLDLHGGVSSKRRVARSFADALGTNATIARPDLAAEHRRLEARRSELNQWSATLHRRREPWQLSLFESQQRMLILREAAETDVRLRGRHLQALTPVVVEHLREDLRQFVGLGGLRTAPSSPWAGAPMTTREQIEAARDLVDDLALRSLGPILDRLEHANAAMGLSAPDSVGAWSSRLELWSGIRQTLRQFDGALLDEALEPLARRLAPLAGGVAARMAAAIRDGEHRAARRHAKGLQRPGVKLSKPALLDAVKAACDHQRAWQSAGGVRTPRAPDDLDELLTDHAALTTSLAELSRLLRTDVADDARHVLSERLRALRADTLTLARLPDLHRLRTILVDAGLGALVADLASWQADMSGALDTFEYCWTASVVDEIRLHDARVGGFEGTRHDGSVDDFQDADRRHITTTAHRVRRRAAERARRIGDEQPDQATLVKREAAKKTRHRPVRETFDLASEVMTSIKPCWVMSPLVVSQVLPNDRPYFDVVVFDEASQIRPAEAIPAIARGRQIVVAGDEQQLPPTDFFSGPTFGSDDDDDRLSATSTGFESILDTMLFLVSWEMLSWHYRSTDERLIAFSNVHLYGRSMLTFPGISGTDCLHHVLVPWRPDQADGEDSSSAEVSRVVELVLEHIEQRPHESLGVIAMGVRHADRVDAALRRALQHRPDLDDFFDEAQVERFFVKNLERVQGDERDAIILTVGYGKSPDGRMYYRFGPLNDEGGERRLNVAVTRARRRMTVVSSFGSTELDPERTKRGTDLLRRYLAYVESGGDKLDHRAAQEPELGPFELDVRDALRAAGIPVICQYGVSGCRLDFVAAHPDRPERLVLAIEADGARYHSSRTARDRDRLRQEQLERLGWRFHRIWSQDWFADRRREVERVLTAYRAAVLASDTRGTAFPRPVAPRLVAATSPPRDRGPRPDVQPWGQIDEFTESDLDEIIRWIESDTLLRSRDELVEVVVAELGFKRRGKRIVLCVGAAIDRVRRDAA